MKFVIGFLTLFASITTLAAQPKIERTIYLSCAGVTYDNKHAIHLTVVELAPNKFRAVATATNGEKISILMVNGYGELIPRDPKHRLRLRIRLYEGDQQNQVAINWHSQVLASQFWHQPMTCAQRLDLGS